MQKQYLELIEVSEFHYSLKWKGKYVLYFKNSLLRGDTGVSYSQPKKYHSFKLLSRISYTYCRTFQHRPFFCELSNW